MLAVMVLAAFVTYGEPWLVPEARGYPFKLASCQHLPHHPPGRAIDPQGMVGLQFQFHEPLQSPPAGGRETALMLWL